MIIFAILAVLFPLEKVKGYPMENGPDFINVLEIK